MKIDRKATYIVLEFKTFYYNCQTIIDTLGKKPDYSDYVDVDNCTIRFIWNTRDKDPSQYVNDWLIKHAYILSSFARSLENNQFIIELTTHVNDKFYLQLTPEATEGFSKLENYIRWDIVDTVDCRKKRYYGNRRRDKLPQLNYLYYLDPVSEVQLEITKSQLTSDQMGELLNSESDLVTVRENNDLIVIHPMKNEFNVYFQLANNLVDFYRELSSETQEKIRKYSVLKVDAEVFSPVQNIYIASKDMIPGISIMFHLQRKFYYTEDRVATSCIITGADLDMHEIEDYFHSNISVSGRRRPESHEDEERPDHIVDYVRFDMGVLLKHPQEFLKEWLDINRIGLDEFRENYPHARIQIDMSVFIGKEQAFFFDQSLIAELARYFIELNICVVNNRITYRRSLDFDYSDSATRMLISTKLCLGPKSSFKIFPHNYRNFATGSIDLLGTMNNEFANLHIFNKYTLEDSHYTAQFMIPNEHVLAPIPAGQIAIFSENSMSFTLRFRWAKDKSWSSNRTSEIESLIGLAIGVFIFISALALCPTMLVFGDEIAMYFKLKDPYGILIGLGLLGIFYPLLYIPLVLARSWADVDTRPLLKLRLKKHGIRGLIPTVKMVFIAFMIVYIVIVLAAWYLGPM